MRAAVITISLLAGLLAPAWSAEPVRSLLVTPTWLAGHLEDPSTVVLHIAGVRADYDREHIPGARFMWTTWVGESTPDATFELPAPDELEKVFEKLGVSNDSHVVLCHTLGDVAAAARVYIALDRLGMGDRTSILDGGLEAWKAEQRPVTRDVTKIRRGSLASKHASTVTIGVADVVARYRAPGVRLVDARSAQAFNLAGGPGVVRGGHIPGAVNLPATSLVDSTNRYLPADSLRSRFATAGIQPGDEIVAYCNVGRTACPVYVAARMLGYSVRLYDGSFEEWSRRLDLPVEGKPAK